MFNFSKLWNFSKPDETEIKFRELLAAEGHPNDSEYSLQLSTQIARTLGLQRKFEEASALLEQVEKRLGPETPVAEICFLLERGRVLNSSQKAAEALPFFLRAYNLACERNEDNLAVDAAHMVAIAEKDPIQKMEWNLKALFKAEASSDPEARGWLGSLYNNIGWTYHSSGNLTAALENFEKALSFRESKGEPNTIRVAKWCVARAHRSLGHYAMALEIQNALEQELSQIQEKDGYVFEELAELHLVSSNSEKSKKYFALASEELSKDEWFRANESARLERMNSLAR